jgi:hypothetical protein
MELFDFDGKSDWVKEANKTVAKYIASKCSVTKEIAVPLAAIVTSYCAETIKKTVD